MYTINPNGTGRRQLTHVAAAQAAGAPDWSPDGARIVYASNQTGDYRIWVMNADGSGQRRLTNDPGFADLESAWSPDGTHILFSRCDDHVGFILSLRSRGDERAGTGMRRWPAGHWTYVRGQYSPDGRHIVVGADRGGLLSALWVMRSDGTDLHRITRPSLEAFWPGWSPDGRRIVFTDNCCQCGSNIWTVRPNGTGLRELTHFVPHRCKTVSPATRPTAGGSSCNSNGKCPARGICQYFYVMNADGSGLHPVRTGVPYTFLTDWGPAAAVHRTDGHAAKIKENQHETSNSRAPDTGGGRLARGRLPDDHRRAQRRRACPPATGRIAFFDFVTDQVYAVNPDGSGTRPAHPRANRDRGAPGPDWSPNGSRVLFARVNLSNFVGRIWIMNADGTGAAPACLRRAGIRDYQPRYTPDGRHIVFTHCSP